MITQFGHVADRTYSYDEEQERKAFTLFWELHDERRPFLSRRLIERFVELEQNADKEVTELLNNTTLNYETTGRTPKGI